MQPRFRRLPRSVRPSIALLAPLLALWLALPAAQAQEPALGASLDGLLAYAREHNPELRMRVLEAQAARERVEPAAALPDPRFQLELMDVSNAMNPGRSASLLPGQVGETRYRVIQPLPFWGKRSLRGEVAGVQAEQSARLAATSAVELEARLKSAYARYYGAAGQTRILRGNLALVEALERLVLTRYSVGLVPQQDALRAQGEITALKVELVDTQQRWREAAARLNALLARDAEAPLAEPVALPPAREALSHAALSLQLRERSPELAGERLGATAAEKSRELTYRNRYPDFAVGLTNNRPRNGSDTWDVMLEVDIPLQQSSRRAQEREAEHMLEAARARVAATEARVNGMLGETLAGYQTNRDKARLLRDTLLPQSEASLRAAQAGYEGGRVDFDTLIEAERQILRTRLALLEAEVEASVRLAELEQLVGAPL